MLGQIWVNDIRLDESSKQYKSRRYRVQGEEDEEIDGLLRIMAANLEMKFVGSDTTKKVASSIWIQRWYNGHC